MSSIEKRRIKIHEIGAAGESQAALFLQKKGFNILAKNYKTKLGEIDVIAQQGDVIAFVEVKTRTSHYFHASLLITPSKQRKIAFTAKQFIQENNLDGNFVLRFDTVFVSHKENGVEFEYIPNAFHAPSLDHR